MANISDGVRELRDELERGRNVYDGLVNAKTIALRLKGLLAAATLEAPRASAGSEAAPPEPYLDPHSPASQSVVERWLLAYQVGEAKEGDCKGIMANIEREKVRKGVAAGLEEAEKRFNPMLNQGATKYDWRDIQTAIRALDPEAIAKRVSEGREKGAK